MAEGGRPAVGLSIGATNLAAVSADRALIRKSVLTLYRRRALEVGVPSAASEPTEPCLVITDFVDRIGDPAGVVAADGSIHRSETLVADGLQALAEAITDGSTPPEIVVVAHPSHWRHAAVDALTTALSRVSGWSGDRLVVVADSAAMLTALQADSGLPSRGIIAVCDFGGSGTSLTLVDAADGYQPVGPTVRHADLSGDRIDQALLDRVIADVVSANSLDTTETSAIDSLTRLRTACRRAKEELSSTTATTVTVELASLRSDVRITRAELDDVIRRPLEGFITLVQETLQHSRIRAADLVAVAAVGGGANTPTVTTTLIEHLRVPVITTSRPQLAAAAGAALRATHGPADNSATGVAATTPHEIGSLGDPKTAMENRPQSGVGAALAWSEVDDDSEVTPFFDEHPEPVTGDEELTYGAWYRRPEAVLVGVLLVVVIVLAVVMIALRHTPGGAPTTPTTSVSSTPSPAPSTPEGTSTTTEVPDTDHAPAPPPKTPTQPPPPPPETTYQPPATTAPPPPPETTYQPPATTAPPPETPPPSEAPPPTQAPTTAQPPRVPQHPPTNPFKPRDPSLPNPFAPRNPFAPANPRFWQPPPQPRG